MIQTSITIDEFARVELRLGTIIECTLVEESKKLLCMQVDFGKYGIRQILAGVRKFYAPEELIGRQALFCYNLKSRKMLGLESQGMLLCAEDDRILSIISPISAIADGTRLT